MKNLLYKYADLKASSKRRIKNSQLKLRQGQMCQFVLALILVQTTSLSSNAQEQANGYGFNYFERGWFMDDSYGAGYSFYAAAWPIMQEYPGPERFQLGLPSTWLTTNASGDEPDDFYTTIEGGLGWWSDTRFATETPKFIMGGVALNFSQWANGVGAGSSATIDGGFRDWTESEGKYGVAQLSQHILWPPDGLNIEQGANGEYLGYGYHPLPLTDIMEETYGEDFTTGNQCWTLFLNSTNFKGPVAFFLPTFWTEVALDEAGLEGLLLDSRQSDSNLAFAMEYASSPALVGEDDDGNIYARILPLSFPKTDENSSDVIRDINVYSKNAKWNDMEAWFAGGEVASTQFEVSGSEAVYFEVYPEVDGNVYTESGTIDEPINMIPYAEKINSLDQTTAGFEWGLETMDVTDDNFIMPSFYKLNDDNEWIPVAAEDVPASTGLIDTEPTITPRNDETPYLTPLESDCHLDDPDGPWNSPGPSAGPFYEVLGDGSKLTYYWYRFIDQPAIMNANLPDDIRENLQERIELIHANWGPDDEYLAAPTGGQLVGLDPGLIVTPPEGMEIGYVPIVTRQEKYTPVASIEEDLKLNESEILVYPNPTQGTVYLTAEGSYIEQVILFNAQGQVVYSNLEVNKEAFVLELNNQPAGIYFLNVVNKQGSITKQIVKK